ncbi:hypothetical protein QBC39DRAFT_12424 [Podospora conica]|nr:hypothetical protein QBC39DRAFT_12424 [Schizothecium conicum]
MSLERAVSAVHTYTPACRRGPWLLPDAKNPKGQACPSPWMVQCLALLPVCSPFAVPLAWSCSPFPRPTAPRKVYLHSNRTRARPKDRQVQRCHDRHSTGLLLCPGLVGPAKPSPQASPRSQQPDITDQIYDSITASIRHHQQSASAQDPGRYTMNPFSGPPRRGNGTDSSLNSGDARGPDFSSQPPVGVSNATNVPSPSSGPSSEPFGGGYGINSSHATSQFNTGHTPMEFSNTTNVPNPSSDPSSGPSSEPFGGGYGINSSYATSQFNDGYTPMEFSNATNVPNPSSDPSLMLFGGAYGINSFDATSQFNDGYTSLQSSNPTNSPNTFPDPVSNPSGGGYRTNSFDATGGTFNTGQTPVESSSETNVTNPSSVHFSDPSGGGHRIKSVDATGGTFNSSQTPVESSSETNVTNPSSIHFTGGTLKSGQTPVGTGCNATGSQTPVGNGYPASLPGSYTAGNSFISSHNIPASYPASLPGSYTAGNSFISSHNIPASYPASLPGSYIDGNSFISSHNTHNTPASIGHPTSAPGAQKARTPIWATPGVTGSAFGQTFPLQKPNSPAPMSQTQSRTHPPLAGSYKGTWTAEDSEPGFHHVHTESTINTPQSLTPQTGFTSPLTTINTPQSLTSQTGLTFPPTTINTPQSLTAHSQTGLAPPSTVPPAIPLMAGSVELINRVHYTPIEDRLLWWLFEEKRMSYLMISKLMNRLRQSLVNRKTLLSSNRMWDTLGDEVKQQDSDDNHSESQRRRSVLAQADIVKEQLLGDGYLARQLTRNASGKRGWLAGN